MSSGTCIGLQDTPNGVHMMVTVTLGPLLISLADLWTRSITLIVV